MANPEKILVTGWRGIAHSYAVVNQFQCLELLRRPDVQLYFEDAPFYGADWTRMDGLLGGDRDKAIEMIPALPPDVRPDVEIRISFPYDFTSELRAARTIVFGTAEYRVALNSYIKDQIPLDQIDESVIIATPSHWSRDGFIRSGADPKKVFVIPHGVDPAIFHPPTSQQRSEARGLYQFAPDEFVFLGIGAMTANKNIAAVLRSFAAVLREVPKARLLLKGIDALYPSKEMFMTAAMQSLGREEVRLAMPRVVYIGSAMSFPEMSRLYHAADCYVSPYTAEGFNLPVLEAAACGLPVICTAGGPTDDFTTDGFALRINSRETSQEMPDGIRSTALEPDVDDLVRLMQTAAGDDRVRDRAAVEGPDHVNKNYTWKNSIDALLAVIHL